MKDLPEIFMSIDLEMNQPSGKIIQIGAVVGNIYTGEILDRLSIIVNPNEQLSEFIIGLTKIKQEQVDTGIDLLEAYKQLRAMHEKHKCFVNPITWGGGDTRELKSQLEEMVFTGPDGTKDSTLGWPFGRRWIDAKTLFISYRLANKEHFAGGLSKSASKIGVRFDGHAHDARWDAENTFKVYVKLLQLIKKIS